MVPIEIRCSRDHSLRINRAIISGMPPPSSPLLFDYRAFFVGTRDESSRAAAPSIYIYIYTRVYVLVSNSWDGNGGFRGFVMGRF